ncbi:MAG TPA: hypothetical protein VHF89_21050, partial [Solirubrobacteraceae bacterium]|nr:hypothetical protein [Solirubrobacteraceae bacterium]
IAGGVVAALTLADDDELVTHATVPGIGRIEGFVAADARVRPPAVVPRVGRLGPEGARALAAAAERAYALARPGEDSGPRAERERVERSLKEKLYLTRAATGCLRPPPAALAVYAFVFAPPQQQPELENLQTKRTLRGRQRCVRNRLRVDELSGVQVRGDEARAVLRGAAETRRDGEWESREHEWRALLRRVDGDWKIAALDGNDLSYED